MQTTETTPTAVVASVETTKQPIPSIETVAAITTAETDKRAKLAAKLLAKRQAATTDAPSSNVANAAKRVKAKPAKAAAVVVAEKPAKPTQAEREAAQRDRADSRSLERQAARNAVAALYSGSSKPFKAASDRFADLNFANGKAATHRQAGLMLALLTYGAGNFKPNGTFTRAGFNVPASLVNANAKPGETVRAQPESGVLGNMLGRTVDYVSGPKAGRDQASTVLRLNLPKAIAEIRTYFGDKAADGAAATFKRYTSKAA